MKYLKLNLCSYLELTYISVKFLNGNNSDIVAQNKRSIIDRFRLKKYIILDSELMKFEPIEDCFMTTIDIRILERELRQVRTISIGEHDLICLRHRIKSLELSESNKGALKVLKEYFDVQNSNHEKKGFITLRKEPIQFSFFNNLLATLIGAILFCRFTKFTSSIFVIDFFSKLF